jgi:uncharacterized protein YoxC
MTTTEVLLAVIAISVLVMAITQVMTIRAAMEMSRRIDRLSDQMERDVKPLLQSVTRLTDEATRTAALATRQVERFDRLFGDMAARIDETLDVAQAFIQGPARSGMALVSGIQAAFTAFQGIREASRRRRTSRTPAGDEDESLFIG